MSANVCHVVPAICKVVSSEEFDTKDTTFLEPSMNDLERFLDADVLPLRDDVVSLIVLLLSIPQVIVLLLQYGV